MRKEMVKRDLVECVIGLGKNLFYNSPMEACILICATNKPVEKRNKVLFIDGRKFVHKNNAESFITSEQLKQLSSLYDGYEDKDEICGIATDKKIAENDYSLAINRYINRLSSDFSDSLQDLSKKWVSCALDATNEFDLLCQKILESESDVK